METVVQFKRLSEPKRATLESCAADAEYGAPLKTLRILNSQSGIPNGYEIARSEIPELLRRLEQYGRLSGDGPYRHPEFRRTADALRKQIEGA